MVRRRLAVTCCRARSLVGAAAPTMVTPADHQSKGVRLRRQREHRIHPVWVLNDAATSADHDRHAVQRLGVVRQLLREGALRHGMSEVLVGDLADLRP
jgi:hypothetical protein